MSCPLLLLLLGVSAAAMANAGRRRRSGQEMVSTGGGRMGATPAAAAVVHPPMPMFLCSCLQCSKLFVCLWAANFTGGPSSACSAFRWLQPLCCPNAQPSPSLAVGRSVVWRQQSAQLFLRFSAAAGGLPHRSSAPTFSRPAGWLRDQQQPAPLSSLFFLLSLCLSSALGFDNEINCLSKFRAVVANGMLLLLVGSHSAGRRRNVSFNQSNSQKFGLEFH